MSFCVLAHINSNLMETINNIEKVSCLRFVRLPHAGQRNYIEFDNTDGYVISFASHLCTIKFLCTNGGNMGNMGNVWVVAWLVVISGINTTSDISNLLYAISRTVRRVKFETILKYHEWYLCKISCTNHAMICLYYFWQTFCNFHM